jgi:hypothetical protein
MCDGDEFSEQWRIWEKTAIYGSGLSFRRSYSGSRATTYETIPIPNVTYKAYSQGE